MYVFGIRNTTEQVIIVHINNKEYIFVLFVRPLFFL
jgi:hypothetical protein